MRNRLPIELRLLSDIDHRCVILAFFRAELVLQSSILQARSEFAWWASGWRRNVWSSFRVLVELQKIFRSSCFAIKMSSLWICIGYNWRALKVLKLKKILIISLTIWLAAQQTLTRRPWHSCYKGHIKFKTNFAIICREVSWPHKNGQKHMLTYATPSEKTLKAYVSRPFGRPDDVAGYSLVVKQVHTLEASSFNT